MRLRGKDGREQHRIGRLSVRLTDLVGVMRRGQLQQASAPGPQGLRRAIDAIRPPIGCGQGAVGENDDMLHCLCGATQSVEAVVPFGIRQVVMAIDKPASARQLSDRAFKPGVVTLIRD